MKHTLKGTNIEITDAIRAHLEEHLNALDKYYNHVIQARVELGLPSTHHHKGEIFLAEATVAVPGDTLRVEVHNEDLYTAIDHMAHKIKQALIKFKDKHQH